MGTQRNAQCVTCGVGAACTANNRKRYCTGSETDNQCIACRARPASCYVPGVWWKPCDVAKYEDDSVCKPCRHVNCKGNQHKELCTQGATTEKDNSCVPCNFVFCGPGEFFKPCNPQTDHTDTAKCIQCPKKYCGVGTYRKTCELGQTADTCASCTTNACGIGFFRARCNGTQVVDAACQECADTVVCPQNQYKILCDGVLDICVYSFWIRVSLQPHSLAFLSVFSIHMGYLGFTYGIRIRSYRKR